MKEMFRGAVHMIIIKDDKILVQKRNGTKMWCGYYGIPAGHIDKGENQYETLIREAKEELNIDIDINDIISSYTVLRRNYFELDGKVCDPYIDFYFVINNFKGTPTINEKDKCDELFWVDKNNLPQPFINYSGEFLNNMDLTTYDCKSMTSYTKKLTREV